MRDIEHMTSRELRAYQVEIENEIRARIRAQQARKLAPVPAADPVHVGLERQRDLWLAARYGRRP